jgi:hypothetical protein
VLNPNLFRFIKVLIRYSDIDRDIPGQLYMGLCGLHWSTIGLVPLEAENAVESDRYITSSCHSRLGYPLRKVMLIDSSSRPLLHGLELLECPCTSARRTRTGISD